MGNNSFFKVFGIIDKYISLVFHNKHMILKLIQQCILSACFNIKLELWFDPVILVALELFLPTNPMPETDV